MIRLFTFLAGALLAVMVYVNGNLSLVYGALWAAVIIHVVGCIAAAVFCMGKNAKEKTSIHLTGYHPWWIYLGGAVGVFTTVFTNLACIHIGITSVTALGLLGQTIAALTIDSSGLFDMNKVPFNKSKLTGIVFSLIGIAVMLDVSDLTAVTSVILSVLAGVTIVLSRTINSRLARHVGALNGSLVNHLVGLPCAVLAAFLLPGMKFTGLAALPSLSWWIYLGGVIGVFAVLISNLLVPRLPSFQITTLNFAGQMAAGILLDLIMKNGADIRFVYGGILVAFGMVINFILEKIEYIKINKTN